MTRLDKWLDYREEIKKSTLNTIDYNLDYIGDKLNEICEKLESQSKSLYQIAKYDYYIEDIYKVRPYKEIFDELMGNPIEELENLFKCVKK